MISELSELFTRDLNKVIAEVGAYPGEEALWQVTGQISNSAGNLALHLAGNLAQFIGTDLGGVPYARDRDAEFSRRNVPRADLVTELERVRDLVQTTFAGLSEDRLAQVSGRPLPGFPTDMSTGFLLLHLLAHLNYHLGQINYHRRLTVPA